MPNTSEARTSHARKLRKRCGGQVQSCRSRLTLTCSSGAESMVKVVVGNLLESNAQTLVNTVNCVGIMGKGIALEFKKGFPEMFEDYAARCQRGNVKLGRPYLYKGLLPPWILNFP